MAALMSSEMDRTDAVVKFIGEAKQMGIEVLPPDVNESNMFFTVVGPNIRFGLGAVKGVGESAVESVLEARQKIGRFSSLLQFCEEVDLRACNKKVLEALIKSGSFDFVGTLAQGALRSARLDRRFRAALEGREGERAELALRHVRGGRAETADAAPASCSRRPNGRKTSACGTRRKRSASTSPAIR